MASLQVPSRREANANRLCQKSHLGPAREQGERNSLQLLRWPVRKLLVYRKCDVVLSHDQLAAFSGDETSQFTQRTAATFSFKILPRSTEPPTPVMTVDPRGWVCFSLDRQIECCQHLKTLTQYGVFNRELYHTILCRDGRCRGPIFSRYSLTECSGQRSNSFL